MSALVAALALASLLVQRGHAVRDAPRGALPGLRAAECMAPTDAGYLNATAAGDVQLYFAFFEGQSVNETSPVVLWLQAWRGGSGGQRESACRVPVTAYRLGTPSGSHIATRASLHPRSRTWSPHSTSTSRAAVVACPDHHPTLAGRPGVRFHVRHDVRAGAVLGHGGQQGRLHDDQEQGQLG